MRSLLYAAPLAASFAFGLAACGNAGPPAGENPGPDGGTDMTAARPGDPQSLKFDLIPFTLQPGEEKVLCQYVPPDGKERYIRRFVTDMAPGSHHLVVFRVADMTGLPASGPSDCKQAETPQGFDGMLPGSQQLHSELALPDGVAMKLEKFHGLYFQEHYINASKDKPLTSGVTWSIDLMPKEKVQQEAGMLFLSDFKLDVPPGMSVTTTHCGARSDSHLVTATGHMHMRGIHFDASVAGAPIYHTDNWDEPDGSVFPSPGFTVKAGEPIEWSCAYNNTGTKTLHFGNSAILDEMCILAAVYYPVPAGAPYGGTDFFGDGKCATTQK